MGNSSILDTELLQLKTIEFLPTIKQRSPLALSNKADCCVAIDAGVVNIQWVPGYNGQSFVAAFTSHHSLTCPNDLINMLRYPYTVRPLQTYRPHQPQYRGLKFQMHMFLSGLEGSWKPHGSYLSLRVNVTILAIVRNTQRLGYSIPIL